MEKVSQRGPPDRIWWPLCVCEVMDIGDVAAFMAAIIAVLACWRSGRRDTQSSEDAAEAKRLAEKANGVAEQHLEASVYPFVHGLPIQLAMAKQGLARP